MQLPPKRKSLAGSFNSSSTSECESMTQAQPGVIGIVMITALLNGDRNGFNLVVSGLEGGNAEAVAILARLSETMIAMIAGLLDVDQEEALRRIAASITLAT